MQDLTGSNIFIAVLVIVAVAGILTALQKGIEAWRELSGKSKMEKSEKQQNDRLDTLEDIARTHEARMDENDKQLQRLRDDTSKILESLNALLLHMISGNDRDKLSVTQKDLINYMSKRK